VLRNLKDVKMDAGFFYTTMNISRQYGDISRFLNSIVARFQTTHAFFITMMFSKLLGERVDIVMTARLCNGRSDNLRARKMVKRHFEVDITPLGCCVDSRSRQLVELSRKCDLAPFAESIEFFF
jgi:hypothetical protein